MVEARHALADAAGEATMHGAAAGEERLPLAQAAALIVAMSVGVWAVIALGLGLLVS